MKKLFVFLLIALLSLNSCSSKIKEEEIIPEQLIPITTYNVEKQIIEETFLALGKIESQNSLSIDTGGNGTVVSVPVKTGEFVDAGDILFILDSDSLKLNYNASESQLRTTRDNLLLQLNDEKEQLQINESLYSKGAISKIQRDDSKNLVMQLEKQYENAISAYNNQVKNLKTGIEDRTVRSPISGKIAAIYIKENEDVQNKVALEIINDENIIGISEVTAKQVNTLKIGGKAVIYPDGDITSKISGNIVRFNEIPNSITGLFEVEISIDNSQNTLKNGEYIEIDFIVAERESLVIPRESVKKVGDRYIVFKIENNTATEIIVKPGITKDKFIEIFSGLKLDETIAVKGNAYLKDGSKINVVE